MLYGVGLGPGDKKLLTLKAIEVIKNVDEVIVPGNMAYDLIKDIREPRIVEFPMGKGDEVAKKLAQEIAERDDDIAFCCLGDPTFYSTFNLVLKKLRKIKNYDVEIIPGISSISCALAKTTTMISKSVLITTQDFHDVDTIIVLKAKKPRKIKKKLVEDGFSEITLIERMFMEGEKVYTAELPEKADYFSVLIARR